MKIRLAFYMQMKKQTRKALTWCINLGCLSFPILVFLGVNAVIAPQAKSGINVDSVDWLPDTASNISYYSRSGFGSIKFAVFTISEKDIQAYTKQNNWTLRPIETVDMSVIGEFVKTEQINYLINNALYAEDVDHSDSGGTRIAYDPQTERAYYSFSVF